MANAAMLTDEDLTKSLLTSVIGNRGLARQPLLVQLGADFFFDL